MFQRLLATIALQGFAVLTAMLHQHLGVQTDEAKYLLNIPYPHPPLLRWIMGLTDGWVHQELFWRILIASFLAHGVWLVTDMTRGLQREQRITACGLWLFSGALLLQSGTVMMAPVTAVQALFLCWMLTRPAFLQRWSVLAAALWLEMLFTAYQGILFAPLVWIVLQKADLHLGKRLAAFGVPVVLLALYTLTNPLAIVAMGFAGTMRSGIPLEQSLLSLLKLWMIGGSGVLSVLGVWGMIRSMCQRGTHQGSTHGGVLLGTLLLVTMYCALSYREYYAILFLPLFIAGIAAQPKVLRSSSVLAAQIVAGVALFLLIPFPNTSHAREVGAALRQAGDRGGFILIHGDFGHEWQYWIPGPVSPARLKDFAAGSPEDAQAVVCLDPCEGIDTEMWWRIPDIAEEVYVRRVGTVEE